VENQINRDIQSKSEEKGTNKHTCAGFGAGALCPVCKKGRLDYNSLLNLACEKCGWESAASFT